MTYFDGGQSLQVFNSLWYPTFDRPDAPLLGVDLLRFGPKKFLCIVDAQPPQGRAHATHDTSTLDAIKRKYPVLEGEVVFWDEEVNEEPEEFLDDEEIARYRATSDRMKAELTDLTRLGFTEADTIYPLFYVGRARSGSIVGLWTARVDT